MRTIADFSPTDGEWKCLKHEAARDEAGHCPICLATAPTLEIERLRAALNHAVGKLIAEGFASRAEVSQGAELLEGTDYEIDPSALPGGKRS